MDDFAIPYIKEEVPTLSPQEASKEAFYATAMSNEPDPVGTYTIAKTDLETKGTSDFVDSQKNRWVTQVEKEKEETIIGIVNDPTVDNELKKTLLRNYAVTQDFPSTLKDRYIQKTATIDAGETIYDTVDQDATIEELGKRVIDNKTESVKEEKYSGFDALFAGVAQLGLGAANSLGLLDDATYKMALEEAKKQQEGHPILGGIGRVGGLIGISIPATMVGAPVALGVAASATIAGIVEGTAKYAEVGVTKATQEERLKSAMTSAGFTTANFAIPIIKAATIVKAMLLNGAGNVVLGELERPIQNMILEAHPELQQKHDWKNTSINAVAGMLIGAAFGRKSVMPKVPDASPLAAADTANPTVASNLAKEAIKEPTGKLAEALGTTKGAIVHDWIMPKRTVEEVTDHPNLVAKQLKTIEGIKELYQDTRYDANLINVTAREAEVGQILKIINESRGPFYLQSKSVINETDELFSGNAVYGATETQGFRSIKAAKEGLEQLKSKIDELPEELRGTLDIVKYKSRYYINHQWKKEYSELTGRTFGANAIETKVLGVDVSGRARAPIGRWLFASGRFPQWMEFSAIRGPERAARIKKELTDPIQKHITGSKHSSELADLVEKAETEGKDYFSKLEIAQLHPHLSSKEVNDLFETHSWWRLAQEVNYNFLNREKRNQLVANDMQGLYTNAGDYIGPATTKISKEELDNIDTVWDFHLQQEIPVTLAMKESGEIVRLADKIVTGNIANEYALVGKNTHLNLLPLQVINKIPGYSGRRVAESFYIKVAPTHMKVNGKDVRDPLGLDKYSKVVAATTTKREGDRLVPQLQEKYPNHIITVRPEREESFGRVMTDYQIHQEMLSHSMKRGERLPSYSGKAKLEDRMTTLLDTIQSLARMGAFREWDEAVKSAYVKKFATFLNKGQFPKSALDITPREGMGELLKKDYQEAHAIFKYYERMKNFETWGDFQFTQAMHWVADILENQGSQIASKLLRKEIDVKTPLLRGKHKNPLMLGKLISTINYIILAPFRQHIVQYGIQQLEMSVINPKNAAKNLANTATVRMYLGADAKAVKNAGLSEYIKSEATRLGKMAGEPDFVEVAEAIRKSGLLYSVDENTIIHGVFKEVDRHLKETNPEKIWKDIRQAVKAPVKVSRALGFDMAEIDNRVANWLNTKDFWEMKNPGKSWKTKEAQEEISAEALRLSGAMNRAAMLPYQEGFWSIPFQFAAIQQKMLLNLLQDNATILTGKQRAQLAATRFALYGGVYGIPGGFLAEYLLEHYGLPGEKYDPQAQEFAIHMRKNFVDWGTNKLIGAFVYPEDTPDLAMAKMMSPYSEGILPYFNFAWETLKLFDKEPAGPKYPAFSMLSSFGQAIEDMKGWWTTREVTEGNYKQIFMEAAEVASGMNSFNQGRLMLGMQDKITKMGNKYGMEFTRSEAYAKMVFGIGTYKEEDTFKLLSLQSEKSKQNKEMAKVIQRQISNQVNKRNDLGEDEYLLKMRLMSSFFSVMDSTVFSPIDKLEVMEEVEKLDKYSYKTLKQSILMNTLKHYKDKNTTSRNQSRLLLERMAEKNPELQQVLNELNKAE